MSAVPPPSITPRQMTLLRVVTAMAWSDGHLAEEEIEVMLDRFSQLFAGEPEQQNALKTELREYMIQNMPLEGLIPKLATDSERELVLRLGYEVIGCSSRTPEEPMVNEAEAAAYQKLVSLLDLPADVVQRVETELKTSAAYGTKEAVENLITAVESFLN